MSFLQKIDALADEEAPIHRLNISGDRVYRSALGGFCTLMIGVTFLLLLISESDEVVQKRYPFVQSKPVTTGNQGTLGLHGSSRQTDPSRPRQLTLRY